MNIRNVLKALICRAVMKACSIMPINNNKVLFISFYGLSYSDNPGAISTWLEKNYPELDIVWCFRGKPLHPDGIRTVSVSSLRYIYELATAKVWVDNCRKRPWIAKRKGQFYMQTWHGGVPLKMVEKDVQDKLPRQYVRGAINDSKMANVMLAECEWRAQNYLNAFWYTGEILRSGLPRSDVFFRDSQIFEKKVKTFYQLSNDIHIVLYAPTFRNTDNLDYLRFNYTTILRDFEERFGGEWIILVRLHPNVAKYQDVIVYSENVLNGSRFPDMTELLCGCQTLITDYSGCIFDSIYLEKPTFIYAPDLDNYANKERNLYFDIQKLPAPFASTQQELSNNIKHFDEKKFAAEARRMKQELGYFGSGHASEIAGKKIVSVIYGKE